MTSMTAVALTISLMFLGVTALVLALLARSYSVHGRNHRAAILATLGALALLGMSYLVLGSSWQTVWEDILWPMLVTVGGAGAGLAIGLGLIYLIVAQR
jgi:hypothetical protein